MAEETKPPPIRVVVPEDYFKRALFGIATRYAAEQGLIGYGEKHLFHVKCQLHISMFGEGADEGVPFTIEPMENVRAIDR